MGKRKFINELSLGRAISNLELYNFLKDNYTQEELVLLMNKLFNNLKGEASYSNDYYMFFSEDLNPKSSLYHYFMTNNFREIIRGVNYCSTFYSYVWSSVGLLISRKSTTGVAHNIINAILEWKLEIDCTPEEVNEIKTKVLGKLARTLEKVKEVEISRVQLKEKFSPKDLRGMLLYISDNTFFKFREDTKEEKIQDTLDNLYYGSFDMGSVNDGTYNRWYMRPNNINIILFFLLKPLDSMPLYLYSDLYLGAIARWRLSVAK